MDPRAFDDLSRGLSQAGSRRGLLGLLAAVPLVGGLVALLDVDETDAKRRRTPPHDAHHARGLTAAKKHKHKKRKKKCKAHSTAQTCAGTCGLVRNNCKKTVACEPCACNPPCAVCFLCNKVSSVCEPDPNQQGDPCGAPGQVCQADGRCACEASSCDACETCQGDGTCSDPCDGTGCCASGACEPGTMDAACGTGGGACVDCGVGRRCVSGQCICDSMSCSTGCCDASGQCQVNNNDFCGTLGVACSASCPDSQMCQGGVCVNCSTACAGCEFCLREADGSWHCTGTTQGGICSVCTSSSSCGPGRVCAEGVTYVIDNHVEQFAPLCDQPPGTTICAGFTAC